MSNNFVIGTNEYPGPSYLKFNGKDIYNSIDWTESGTLKWNAETKEIYVLADPVPPPEVLAEPTIPVNSSNIYAPLKKKPVYKR